MCCLATRAAIATFTTSAACASGSSITTSATISDSSRGALAPDAIAARSPITTFSALSTWSTVRSVGGITTLRYELEVRRIGVGNGDG
jgi:hypothetical protein